MEALERIIVIGLLLGAIYGLVSMGLSLIFGVVRVVNFAHGELVMLGMYGAFFVQQSLHWPVYLTLVIVVPALFLLGVIIQRLVIQPLVEHHTMQIFATFGLGIMLANLILAVTEGHAESVQSSFAQSTFQLGSSRVDFGRAAIFVVTALVAGALLYFLQRTRAGRVIRAVSQDRATARLMGINVERVLLLTFGLGSALAGLAGVMLSPVYSLTPSVGQTFIFAAFTVVVLGGMGHIIGAYIAGILIGLVESLTSYYIDPTLSAAFYFMIFLVVLILRPAGLFGRRGSEELGTR